jgi:hypothetical protein
MELSLSFESRTIYLDFILPFQHLGWWGVREKMINLTAINSFNLFASTVLVLYAVARLYLVVEAFINLRNVPMTVYDTPAWTQLLPHL